MAEKMSLPSVSTLEFNTIELPPSIEIKESSIRMGEAGAFAKEQILQDTRFGPYKGEIISADVKKYIDYRFAWEIFEKNSNVLRHTICAMDSKISNWMRHVNCARFYEEQNILSVQDGFSIFYVAMKDIKPGEELLTWFDPKLLKRTKRRLSKMARKPVGYTIELVPWSDEKKFVPEIIDTKRARKKKVLSDMISLDENPLAITRTLQSLPKLPCTPRQLAQSATYRHLYASLIAEAESRPRPEKRRPTKQDSAGKKARSTPADVFSKHKKSNPQPAVMGAKSSGSSTAWKDVKSSVGASCINKVTDANKISSSTKEDFNDVKMMKSEDLEMKVNLPRPKKLKKSTKDITISMSEEITPKPIIYKSNDDGTILVEDHDETFLLKNMVLRPECDDHCPCLDKHQAMLDQNVKEEKQASFVIHFTLLPEHKTLGPDNKVLYRCDICGNAYNHAFTLKRHYLGIHINHRYLTASDIQSCQIETFHIGTQLEICRPNYPHLPSSNSDIKPTDIFIKKESFCVPSLSQLAKLAINKKNNRQPSVAASSTAASSTAASSTAASSTAASSTAASSTAEIHNKYTDPTLSSNIKTIEQPIEEKGSSFVDETSALYNNDPVSNSDHQRKMSDIETLTYFHPGSNQKPEVNRDDESSVGLEKESLATKNCKEVSVTNECLSANNLGIECEPMNTSTENLKDIVSSLTVSVVPDSADTLSSTLPGISTSPISTTDSDSNVTMHSGLANDISLKPCPAHMTVESGLGSPHSASNGSFISPALTEIKNVKEESSLDTSEVLTMSCEENTSASLESMETVASEVVNKCGQVPDGTSTENVNLDTSKDKDFPIDCGQIPISVSLTKPIIGQVKNIDDTEVSSSSVTVDQLDNIHSMSDVGDKSPNVSLSGDSLMPCETSLLEHSKSAQTERLDSQNVNLTCPATSTLVETPLINSPPHSLATSFPEPINSSSNSIQSPPSSLQLAITNKTSTSPSSSTCMTESVVLPFVALPTEPIASMISPTKSEAKLLTAKVTSCTTSATGSSEASVSASPKNSSPLTPQVIFVTNIVFPLVTPSHKTFSTSAQSPLTTGQAVVTSAGISKSLPLGSQTAGVPLVLISPLPAGISSANAFLQSSTALKTIQSIQNSLNVMSLGNTSTVLTGTKGNVPKMYPSSGLKMDAPLSRAAVHAGRTASGSKMVPPASNISTLGLVPTNSHDGTSQPEDLYRCHMCVLVFKTMSQLKNHIKNDPHRFKGSFKQYGCSQCSMRFSNKTNLLRHNLMSHQEDENNTFRCFTCGKGFSTENYLKMHARFHSGKNFPCKHGCKDLFFPNAGSLVKHLRAYHHSDQEPKDYSKNVKEEEKKMSGMGNASGDQLKALQGSPPMPVSKNPVPYSMTQPGIGFQAKRIKSKPCREQMQVSMKTEPLTDEEKSNDSKETNVDDNNSPETDKLLFKCKVCQNGFSTHLRLLQHRTQKHGASQSVQEYLYQMSKDIYEDDPSDLESLSTDELSPPSSPKTFFSNVNRKGYENMQHFIEGGTECLKNWRKYLKVEDYISLSEPALPLDNTDCKFEWTFYNFPPSFVYKSDCTEYYNEETRAPEIKSEKGTPVQKCLESSVSDAPLTMNEGDVTVKTEVEDNKYGVMSQERCNYIINKLEQHLQATLENESSEVNAPDASSVLTNISDGSGALITDIKTEVEDNDYGVMSQDIEQHPQDNNKNDSSFTADLNKQSSSQDQVNKISSVAKQGEQSKFCDIGGSNIVEKQTSVDLMLDSMRYKDLEEEKVTSRRLDSGLGSLSSTESPASDSETVTRDSMDETSHTSLSEKKQSDDSNVASKIPSCVLEKSVFTELLCQEKLDALKSSLIQSINLESSQVSSLNMGLSSMKSTREIHALNLHITGSQLLSSKMAQIMEKYSSSDLYPFMETKRQRTLSLPSMGFLSPSKEITMDASLNISDASKHDHSKRYSILWAGQIQHKVLKEAGESTFCCPVVETVKKQESLRLKDQYMYEKASRDREAEGKVKKRDLERVEFAKEMGLMQRKEFEMSHHAKKLEEHIIKPPEIWRNYENIWFGKKGTIAVVCSICHRHFSFWDLCLRHQLKKHPHIEPASIEMEKDNDVEDLYYYYPMRYGILAQTQLIPDNLPPLEVYVCTRCGFPFKNLNKLHSHVVTCDPAKEATTFSGSINLSNIKKKLLPMMDRRLTQELETTSSKYKHGKNHKTYSNSSDKKHKKNFLYASQSQVITKLSSKTRMSDKNSVSFSSCFSLDANTKQKNYDLLYNPQNHTRRRESYKVLDQHQCHGCNLKFNSLSMLERHVRKCSGRDKLQSQKPLVSQVIPDDAAVRKQHTCRYCNKRFTYIKGVDLHYKRICAVRKVKEEENQLTEEDFAHEEELKRIIEHMKWSKTLNKDSSDIIQGHVRVEEDGTLTRVVKERVCPKGVKKSKNSEPNLPSSKKLKLEDDLSLASSTSSTSQNLSLNDSKAVEGLELSGCSDKPGRRMTRSSSLEKVSPIYDASWKRKAASTNRAKSTDSVSRENVGKKSKSSNKDKSSRNKGANKTSKVNQTTPLKRASSESTLSREDSHIRLPVRKRGRPQKFDPSDMESSYKKKKKMETSQRQNISVKASPRSNFDSPKLSTNKSTNAQKGGKNAEVSKRTLSKSPSAVNKLPKREMTLAESSKMMEKMKQLKEAARLENDNQIKLKKAKQAKKIAGKKASKSDTDLSLNTNPNTDPKPNKLWGKNQPSELFKQLTKSDTKTMSVKELSPNKSTDNCDKSNPSSYNISTLNSLKRKDSGITPSAPSPPKKANSTISSVEAGLCNTNQDIIKVSSTAESKISTLPKTKIADKKSSGVGFDDSLSGSPKSLTSTLPLKISTLPSKSTAVPGSGGEVPSVPTSKAQPVSVRVVTLSPNGMNLLTFDSPPDVPVKTASASCSSAGAKTLEVSSVLQNKLLKTSSQESVHFIRKVPASQVSACDLKAQDISKIPVTNIVFPNSDQSMQSPISTACITIKKPPLQGKILKPDDSADLIQANDHSASENQVIMPVVVNAAAQDKAHGPAISTNLLTLAKHQGYSVLKTSVGSVQLSTPGVQLSTPGDSIASNQNSINSQGQNILKLTSPVQKFKPSGESDGIKLSGLIKPGHTVKLGSRSLVSNVGDTIHLINPSKLSTPTSIVLSTGSNTNSSVIVSGSVPNLIVAPALAKSCQTTNTLPSLVAQTKLRTPPSRFASPQATVVPNIIHGTLMPPGTRVLKIGNTLSTEANIQGVKSNAASKVTKNIPEKNLVISTVSVPRNPGSNKHPRLPLAPQSVSCAPRQQIITLNANRFSSRAQPTFIVQHSSSPAAHHAGNAQPITNIVTKSSSPAGATTVRTASSKYITNERSKQLSSTTLPQSLLTNQIMISLDDGTTAMLDPDSLAQLLSLSPSLNKSDLGSEPPNIITDPEHVMVNMAEIQPTRQQPSDDISWPANGSVDLTDLPDSMCDL